MTISEQEREALIQYRLEQAQNSANDAELLMKNEKIPAAINRIYYAVFYCVLALALKEGYKTSKHMQLIGWFNKTFIATGKIENDYGRILRDCYEYRKSADYDTFVNFNRTDINLLYDEMKSFIAEIERYISEK
ncbi:HEPN domain-containing protein [Mariniphaga sp.]|uniref:HEPN domain-containing protein n=1 Tax=Mariniphaga sp. TaxID=1954475 RepID=UPI0035651365